VPLNKKHTLLKFHEVASILSIPCRSESRIMEGGGKERIHTSVRYIADDMNRSRSQWPRGPRRSSAAARLLGLWVRILSGEWMYVCCVFRVSGTGLGKELISRPHDSYRLWCVAVSDVPTSRMRRLRPALSHSATGKKIIMNRIINAGNN